MNFDNKNIVCDEWDVKYADDAHAILEKLLMLFIQRTKSFLSVEIKLIL